jgi:hypothetical protein
MIGRLPNDVFCKEEQLMKKNTRTKDDGLARLILERRSMTEVNKAFDM